MSYPTPQEIGREAREALARSRETPKEHLARLIRLGWVNRRGEITRLMGGDVEPEPYSAGGPGNGSEVKSS